MNQKEIINWIKITDIDLKYLEIKDKLTSIMKEKKQEFVKNKTQLYSLDILSGVWFSDLNKIKFFWLIFSKINARLKGNNLKYSYFYDNQNDTLNILLYHNYRFINKCIITNITKNSTPIQLFTIIIFISKNKIPLNLIKKI